MTVIMATHDPQIAAQCERLVRLREGRVIDDLVVCGNGSNTLRRISQLSV